MAASSSSVLVPSSSISSLGSFTYQVFLSFRGKDTRQSFIGHLSKALEDARIRTFIDDEGMKAGDHISETLLKAIKESMYCVVILSKGYADSKWCLKELAAMFEHKKEIIPVMYYVEPSHVRHQKGPSFEQSFKNHEIYNPAYVEEWREAMTKVGQLKGFSISDQSNKKEVELIQEIVERVGGCSDNVILPVADHPVGIDNRVEEVMKLLSIEEEGVKMVGIYGMGGIGKTTLAKEIHNRLRGRFEKTIYIECIKDKKDNLPKLQEEFISKAFKHGKLEIYNSSEGIAEIRMRFCHTRLLAILDDVDHRDQLKALAGGCDWFGEGTRILITTRDKHLLDAHRVDGQYEVQELNSRDSLRLFSWYAFNNEKPSEEYMEISQQVAEAAGGLPLALEVLGSSLTEENSKRIWEQVVTRLRGLKYDDINGRLRISYDGLDQEEQKIFLDIACFFIYEEKWRILDILRGCDFKTPELSIDVLLQKSLLKVDDRGKLHMHDLLRDMGRNTDPHTWLWDQQQVWDVLNGHTEKHEIEGIVCQRIPEREEESLDVEAVTNMSNLRLLLLENIHPKGDFSKMPTSLRSKLQRIRVIDSADSDMEELDESIWHLPNLKELNLQYCKKLKCLPISIGCLTLLRYLNLWGCESLTALPESIGGMKNLQSLVLGRSGIKELPNSMKSLSSLELLNINRCVKLRGGIPLCDLERLRTLQFVFGYDEEGEETNEEVPDDMVEMSGYSQKLHQFRRIRFIGCDDDAHGLDLMLLNRWELSITMGDDQKRVIQVWEQVYIATLEKWQWLKLIFPQDFDRRQSVAVWPSLSKQLGQCLDPHTDVLFVPPVLRICEIDTQSLPDTIGCLSGLRILRLRGECEQLTCLPESIGYLTRLQALDLRGCTCLSTLPNSIENLSRLEVLDLSDCTSLKLLPNSIGNLKRLWFLKLAYSGIEVLPDSFPLLESLERLNIIGCYRLQGRLPLWEMKSLKGLAVGAEVGEKDVSEILNGITHYSQQAKEYRRIKHRNIQDEQHWVKLGLSIWVKGSLGREIELRVYRACEVRKGQSWLRHIFPKDFTPQYDTRTRSEASASHSSPSNG